MSESNGGLMEEIEALKAILMDEVIVKTDDNDLPIAVETVVFPSTADNALEQYVCVTLEVSLPPGYPEVMPMVTLRNPRGLDDSFVVKIEADVREKCEEFHTHGQPVIYEVIELVREHLTSSNVPSCQCAVCLYGFREGDQFTKTECYHYFHSHCLACHAASTERIFREEQEKLPAWQRERNKFKVACPVCREPITCDAELASARMPLDVEAAQAFEPTTELRRLQCHMAKLFAHQKQRGGIIDLDANDSKGFLVTAATQPLESLPVTRVLPPAVETRGTASGPSVRPSDPEPPRRGRGSRGRGRHHKSRGSRHFQAATSR